MTKSIFVRIVCLICAILLLSTCIACNSETASAKAFKMPDSYELCDSAVVDENDHYILKWDSEKCCVLLVQKSDGYIWSTIPYDFYTQDDNSAQMSSPLFVDYIDASDHSVHTAKGYTACVKKDNYSASITDKKLKVVYTFEDLEFSIPVIYSLEDDHIKTTVDVKNISENKNRIYKVSIAPYLCSVVNGTENSYLFVPSGSGALMYTDKSVSDPRTYSAEVYGYDASRKVIETPTNTESIKLPVFGVKNNDHAMMGVISEGAESAEIYAEAGTQKTNYSMIYASFELRGFDIIEDRGGSNQKREIRIYSENMTTTNNMSVSFYPLNGDQADYNGMANKYWQYLESKGAKASNNDETMLSLNILGGTEVKDFMVGIPYRNLKATTTFDEASQIIKTVSSDTGVKPAVTFTGFGQSGLYPGKVGGGFTFPSDYGNGKSLKNLITTAKENTNGYYFDFEIVKFRKNGNGFSTLNDCAKTANLQRSYNYFLYKNVRGKDTTQPSYLLIKRNSIDEAVEKLMKFASKKGIEGVSIGGLASINYSDYTDQKYSTRSLMDSETTQDINNIKKGGFKVAVSDANAYAVVAADAAFDVPLSTDKSIYFDEEIPFYQIVFKGRRSMNSVALNNTDDTRKSVLKAVSYGCGLSFRILNNYDTSLLDAPFSYLNSSVFEDNRDNIKNYTAEFKDYYNKINGASIVEYKNITDKVSYTRFSNGVSITVNIGDSDYDYNGQTVKAGNYIIKEGEVA